MAAPRLIEREFGVPFPGKIVPRESWTHTALKHLPSEGPLNWPELFGRVAPLVLDLGCGNGRFLIGSAIWNSHFNHLGLDELPVVIRYATRRANQRGLSNIRFAVGDAATFVEHLIAPRSVSQLHVYHPQPYYDRRQHARRLICPRFLAGVHRALCPDGAFFLQTDHPAYWDYIEQVLPAMFVWQPHAGPWPDAPKGRTRREIIALRNGLPVFRGVARPRCDLTSADCSELAARLPLPGFDADRRLAMLDGLESNTRAQRPRPHRRRDATGE